MAIRLLDTDALCYEIPKTGTSWVRYALTQLGIEWQEAKPLANVCTRHSLPDHYHAAQFRFCAVRHPITWYESYWRFRTEHEWVPVQFEPDHWYPHAHIPESVVLDFNEWVRSVLAEQPAFVTRLYESTTGPFGLDRMDVVMRQEKLVSDLGAILLRLGYGEHWDALEALDRINVSSHPHPEWDEQLRERVEQIEGAAIRRWYPRQDKPSVKVELGGGVTPRGHDWKNIDLLPCADVQCDLNDGRLPFEDDSVDELYSSHCLEHVVSPQQVMLEVLRVCRVGASVELRLPHWLHSMAMCPGHRHVISDRLVDIWCSHPHQRLRYNRKQFNLTGRTYTKEIDFEELRRSFPKLTDEQVLRLIPNCCHEVRYHIAVVAAE